MTDINQSVPRGADWARDGDPRAIAEMIDALDETLADGYHPRDFFDLAVATDGSRYRAAEMHGVALHGIAACALTQRGLVEAWRTAARTVLDAGARAA